MKDKSIYTGALLFGLVVLGCFNPFAPELTQSIESADLIVTQQMNPEEVLQNFKVSYIFKDSLLYSGLLDTAFVFEYFDPEVGTSGQNISWTRDTELRTTGRLFRHFQVIDLIWHSTIYELTSEDTSKISKQFDLTLISEETDYHVTGRAEFTLKKCWDERWRIKRWKDESEL